MINMSNAQHVLLFGSASIIALCPPLCANSRPHARTQINENNFLQRQRQHLVHIGRVNANQKRHWRAEVGEQRRRQQRDENVLPLERVAGVCF